MRTKINTPKETAPLTGRTMPTGWETYTFVKSYAEWRDGTLYRMEVRKDPASGHMVQVGSPMPVQHVPHRVTPLTRPWPRARHTPVTE